MSASSAEVRDLEQRSELRVADPVPVMFRHQASPAVDVEVADKSPDEARHVVLVVCERVAQDVEADERREQERGDDGGV